MKTKISLFIILLCAAAFAFQAKNPFGIGLDFFYKNFHEKYLPQVSYLRTDKTLYKPSETVWFQVYLRDLNSLEASEAGKSVFVEIFDPKGTSIEKLRLVLENGQASGQFDIPSDASGGLYKILAYSSWQRNHFGAPPFEKTFQVQKVNLPNVIFDLKFEQDRYKKGDNVAANLLLRSAENIAIAHTPVACQIKSGDSVLHFSHTDTDKDGKCRINYQIPQNFDGSRLSLVLNVNFRGETESFRKGIPLTSGEIFMTFVPDGGKIFVGLKNKIAFRLFDALGNAVQAEGFIKKKNGETAARFCTLQKGLGEFTLEAEQGETYFAEIDESEMRGKLIPLPETQSAGVFFAVEKSANAVIVTVRNSGEKNPKLHLTAENGGKIRFNEKIKLKNNTAEIHIPTAEWAAGAGFFTLFLNEKPLQSHQKTANPSKFPA